MKRTLLFIAIVLFLIPVEAYSARKFYAEVSANSNTGGKVAALMCNNEGYEDVGNCFISLSNKGDKATITIGGNRNVLLYSETAFNTIRFSPDDRYVVCSITTQDDKTSIISIDTKSTNPAFKEYKISKGGDAFPFKVGSKKDVLKIDKNGITFYDWGGNCSSSGDYCVTTMIKRSYTGKDISIKKGVKIAVYDSEGDE